MNKNREETLASTESYLNRVEVVLNRIESQIDSTDDVGRIEFLLCRLAKVEDVLNKREKLMLGS
jgi:hypothetical protein